MDNITAEVIGKKARALKHCEKLLSKIDKNGSAKVVLNCTGVEFIVHKDDAIYFRIQKTRYELLEDIKSYQLMKSAVKSVPTRVSPTPVCAAETPSLTPEEIREAKKAKAKEYQHRYYEKKKAEKNKKV